MSQEKPKTCMHCHGPVKENDMVVVVVLQDGTKVEGQVCRYACLIGELHG